jgi:hypothetical protein
MASQTLLTDTGDDVPAIHKDEELCQYLLNSITTKTSLQILPSGIHSNGTGLFTKEVIPEGADVFRSQPLISCLSREHSRNVCDYCLTNSTSKIHPTGHFRKEGESMPLISQCAACGVCGYCSKVRPGTTKSPFASSLWITAELTKFSRNARGKLGGNITNLNAKH